MKVESFSVLEDNMADLAEKKNTQSSIFALLSNLASDLQKVNMSTMIKSLNSK